MHPSKLKILDYTYELPNDKIALFPLEARDQSKLLVYKNNHIYESDFSQLVKYIQPETLLVFNNTRVINARIIMHKSTGAKIEIFCLEPLGDFQLSTNNNNQNACIWTCLVGNAKKWNEEYLKLNFGNNHFFKAEIVSRTEEFFQIKFSWDTHQTFWEIIDIIGKLPLPPYIKREATQDDQETYQTVYAKNKGSVAAPTAGLHFTEHVLKQLEDNKIHIDEITLHVGAGTFKPVKAETMQNHQMHAEYIYITKQNIENLLKHNQRICVGTTSLRTLESLYWIGVKILKNIPLNDILVSQWDAYELEGNYTYKECLEAIHTYLGDAEYISGKTEILIAPGYRIRSVEAIITNFHQPQSTLLLLVAAVVGETWKQIYQYALDNNFRFLSYGDSSLLYVNNE